MNLKRYDEILGTADWLIERDMPVAIVLTEQLEPSGGADAIIFPPTYARRKGDHPYAITTIRTDVPAQEAAKTGVEANICDLDTFGAQANRMEPAFKRAPLSSLVPQLFINAKAKSGADGVRVSLLDAAHRIADGAVRFAAEFGDEAAKAITALAKDINADVLARLAPTSLVFGFWDSRASQYKFPRILSSTIRASNVAALKRSAQFNPTFDPATIGLVIEEEASETVADADEKDPLSKEGLRAAPAVDTHGGVRVYGYIVRRTEINLVALRALAVATNHQVNEEESIKLRRYLLSLALVAGRFQFAHNLRQGCLLVSKDGTEALVQTVFPSGKRSPFAWEFADSYEFAKAAASAFGVLSESPLARNFNFQPSRVAEVIKGKAVEKSARKGKKTKATGSDSIAAKEDEKPTPTP
jgi:CRISPR-associated protein Csb1